MTGNKGKKTLTGVTIALVLGACIFGQRAALASPVSIVVADHSTHPLGLNFSWYEDASRKLEVADAIALDRQGAFKQASPADTDKGYSGSTFWMRFDVENRSNLEALYIDGLNPMSEGVEVFKIGDNGEILRQKNIERRYALAQLAVGPGESARFILKYHSHDVINFSFTLKSIDAVMRRDESDTAVFSIYLGIFLALMAYNIFLFVALRHRQFFYYILFAGANLAVALYSVNFPAGIAASSEYSLYSWSPYLRCLGPVTAFLFAKSFLSTATNFRRMNFAFNGYLIGLLLIVVVFSFAGSPYGLSTAEDLYFLVGIIILMATATYALRKGFRPARYFLFGMGAFLCGIMVYLVYPHLGLPSNSMTLTAHIIGQAFEMLLMSLALASFVKQLEDDKTRYAATVQAKSRLLRIISHDIINPLSIISGFGQILAKKYPEEGDVDRILRSADAIEKVAKYVRKTEGQSASESGLEDVSVKKAFEELAFLFEHVAVEKGIKLTFDMNARDLVVSGQETGLITEVLGNLVSNAIKFSFVGSQVKVQAEAAGDKVIITVKDQGLGMRKDILDGIFHPSRGQSRPGTMGELGSGYGMPIVHSFVQEYNGSIEIYSVAFEDDKANCGTEVRLTLQRGKTGSLQQVPLHRRSMFST